MSIRSFVVLFLVATTASSQCGLGRRLIAFTRTADGNVVLQINTHTGEVNRLVVLDPSPPVGGIPFQAVGAMDEDGSRLFAADPVSGTLWTVDTARVLSSSVPLGSEQLVHLAYDPPTDRLLGLFFHPASPQFTLERIDPATGARAQLGASFPTAPLNPDAGLNAVLDVVGRRLFIVRQDPASAGVMAVMDVDTGALLQQLSYTYYFIRPPGFVWMPTFNQLVTLGGVPTGTVRQLQRIDPNTGAPTFTGPPLMTVFEMGIGAGWDGRRPVLDADSRVLWMLGRDHWQLDTLFSIDPVNGALIQSYPAAFSSDVYLAIDKNTRCGAVSIWPSNSMAFGELRSVWYCAPSHPHQWLFPFISCTPGTYSLGTGLDPILMSWDGCTDAYFSAPSVRAAFRLAGSRGYSTLLSSVGDAHGWIDLVGLAPTGAPPIDVMIGYVTLDSMTMAPNAVHGRASLRILP